MDRLPENKLPALRVMTMPADANQNGDIFGGWIMSHVDIAGHDRQAPVTTVPRVLLHGKLFAVVEGNASTVVRWSSHRPMSG